MSVNDPIDNNQRSELRVPHNETLYVEIYGVGAGTPDDALSATLCASETVDVSANGLQVKIKDAMQSGTIHRLGVIREKTGERFVLMGEVKWQKRLPGQAGFMTGLLLYESDETSIAEWKRAVADMLSDDGFPDGVDKTCC